MNNSHDPNERSEANGEAWEEVLASLCRLQGVLPDAVLVGGTASALYAGHRFSFDHDHVLSDLRERFDAITKIDTWRDARAAGQTLPPPKLPGLES